MIERHPDSKDPGLAIVLEHFLFGLRLAICVEGIPFADEVRFVFLAEWAVAVEHATGRHVYQWTVSFSGRSGDV